MSEFFSGQPGEPGTSHLASNNPFRNRAVSPALPSPTSPFDDPAPRSSTRNPFLDPGASSTHHHTESNPSPHANSDLLVDLDMSSKTQTSGYSQSSISDIFNNIKIDDKSMATASSQTRGTSNGRSQSPFGSGPSQSSRGRGGGMPPPRAKNIPPRPLPTDHRSSHSQEEATKSRQMSAGQLPEPTRAGITIDRSARRPSNMERPRRNSESSVAGEKISSKTDKAMRDSRRRDDHRGKSSRPGGRRPDVIDQLDASSVFGNVVFHHDGPFDALNPHRNRKGSRRAPMQAFPKDSLNNVIGGSGPLNKRPDHKTFMGHNDDEAFKEYARGGRGEGERPAVQVPVFDPLQRTSILHGDESLGLGTSTFLEGTPAARTTIQRQDAEKAVDTQEGGGLQRKKSLAQRFRSINRGQRDGPQARAFSTDGAPISSRIPAAGSSAFDEFDSRKGDDVITVRRKGSGAQVSPTSPPRGHPLERRSTTDGNGRGQSPGEGNSYGGQAEDGQQRTGLLARVKSLKGNRRPAPPPPPMKDL